MRYAAIAFAVAVTAIVTLSAQNPPKGSSDQQRVAKNIATFDDLDFNVFTDTISMLTPFCNSETANVWLNR